MPRIALLGYCRWRYKRCGAGADIRAERWQRRSPEAGRHWRKPHSHSDDSALCIRAVNIVPGNAPEDAPRSVVQEPLEHTEALKGRADGLHELYSKRTSENPATARHKTGADQIVLTCRSSEARVR